MKSGSRPAIRSAIRPAIRKAIYQAIPKNTVSLAGAPVTLGGKFVTLDPP